MTELVQDHRESLETRAWDVDWLEAFLLCPACRGERLERDDSAVRCAACGHSTPIEGGLLSLVPQWPGDAAEEAPAGGRGLDEVARRVRRFYEEHPFPNYDGFETVGDLLARASRSVYAALLDRQIPVGARVVECGCGTGQLGLFLSVGGRAVVGVDLSSASLRLAVEFKKRHGLANCNFLQADLFDLPLRSGAFDLVISKGVLHHTSDARAAFRSICRLVRPGGYVILGLYNRIGRIPTTLRRLSYRLFRRGDPKDFVLRRLVEGDEKARSWFLDQYAHPHETRHTVDEVLAWFDENDLDYVNSVPPIRLADQFDPSAPLFAPGEPGSRLEHWIRQLAWIFTISREGALFDMIGRRRER